jgi:hypothetical protein
VRGPLELGRDSVARVTRLVVHAIQRIEAG